MPPLSRLKIEPGRFIVPVANWFFIDPVPALVTGAGFRLWGGEFTRLLPRDVIEETLPGQRDGIAQGRVAQGLV